jgi:energy-coupling factor transporter ATP-binding protein EcfA2
MARKQRQNKMMKSRKKRQSKHQGGLDRKARHLLRKPSFLYKAIQKVGELGVVGEERNRGIVILTGISKALPEPTSVLVKGPTSSGKSNLVKTTLRLFPANSIVDRAGLSPKALAHGKVSLKHKILFINELRSAKEAQLLLRLLQSEGKIEHEFTTVRGATRGTKTAKRVGMPVVLSTTTDEKVFEDDETRFQSLFVDISPAQSRAIVLARARGPRDPDCSDLPVWQRAMSLLVYTNGDFENPPKWIEYVARKLPRDQVRVRRDWDRFLKYCNAVALWTSFGTKRPVDISFEDYCIAYRILEPVFASTLHSLRAQKDVVSVAVSKLHKRLQRAVTVHELAEELAWKESLVYKHLKRAEKNHLVKYVEGTRERNVKPVLPIDQGVSRFLPSPRSVLKHHPELGKKVKYVDPLSGNWKTVRR